MAGSDGVIQVPPDSSGKKLDTSELTRADGTVVERQRVILADPNDPALNLSLRDVTGQRQLIELSQISAAQSGVNQWMRRGPERPYTMDSRGGSTGRGPNR